MCQNMKNSCRKTAKVKILHFNNFSLRGICMLYMSGGRWGTWCMVIAWYFYPIRSSTQVHVPLSSTLTKAGAPAFACGIRHLYTPRRPSVSPTTLATALRFREQRRASRSLGWEDRVPAAQSYSEITKLCSFWRTRAGCHLHVHPLLNCTLLCFFCRSVGASE